MCLLSAGAFLFSLRPFVTMRVPESCCLCKLVHFPPKAAFTLMKYGTTMTHPPAMERYRAAQTEPPTAPPQPDLHNPHSHTTLTCCLNATQQRRARKAVLPSRWHDCATAPLSLPSIASMLSRPPVRLHHVTHCSYLVLYGIHADQGARDSECE